MKHLVLGPLVALALILAVGVGSVLADPTDHPRADPITVTCGGVVYTIVGPGSAGLVAGSTTVLIATRFEFVDSYTDPETGEMVEQSFEFSIGNGKRTGQQDVLTECTFTERFVDSDLGPVISVVTVTLFTAPRGGQ